jgi:hypothetical protein
MDFMAEQAAGSIPCIFQLPAFCRIKFGEKRKGNVRTIRAIASFMVFVALLDSCELVNSLLGTSKPLNAPASVNVVAGDGQVIVTWSQVSSADSYAVYHKAGTDVSISSNAGASSTGGSSLTITGLSNGTQYAFVVYAKKGQEISTASIIVFATPIAAGGATSAPTAPSNLVVTAGDGQVTLSWTGAANVSSYKVYYKANSATATVSDTLATSVVFNGSSAVVTLPNGSYAFIIVAINAAGSSQSAAVQANPAPQLIAPSAPTGVSATSGDRQATIRWPAVTGAASYQVYYKAGATSSTSDTQLASSSISGTTAVVSGLANGTLYAFIVVATNSAGSSAASAVATVTPMTSTGGSTFTITGALLANYSVSFTLSGASVIAAPDTSGAYPVYTIPQASLPLAITASSMPTATSFQWLLDGVAQTSTGSNLGLTALPTKIHYLTLLLKGGTDPNRSVTVILNATN